MPSRFTCKKSTFSGGIILIQVPKETLPKVLLTRINILTICFPSLERQTSYFNKYLFSQERFQKKNPNKSL